MTSVLHEVLSIPFSPLKIKAAPTWYPCKETAALCLCDINLEHDAGKKG